MNNTGTDYPVYDIPVDKAGRWEEILNTEESIYSGCGLTNKDPMKTVKRDVNDEALPYKITVHLAPFACAWFCHTETR